MITLNRPERMNSMAFDVMVPLKEALDKVNYDNSVRVVVLTGAGRGFSSGADHKSAGSVPPAASVAVSGSAAQVSMSMVDGSMWSRPAARTSASGMAVARVTAAVLTRPVPRSAR